MHCPRQRPCCLFQGANDASCSFEDLTIGYGSDTKACLSRKMVSRSGAQGQMGDRFSSTQLSLLDTVVLTLRSSKVAGRGFPCFAQDSCFKLCARGQWTYIIYMVVLHKYIANNAVEE